MTKPTSLSIQSSVVRRCAPRFAAFSVVVGASLLTTVAHGQQLRREISAQRFDPAPGPRNFLSVRTLRMETEKTFSAGLMVNYGNSPLVVMGDDGEIGVIRSLVTADVLGSYTLMPALELGVKIPVTRVSGDGLDPENFSALPSGAQKTSLGDPSLEAKYRIYGKADGPLTAGAGAYVTAPLGSMMAEGYFIGDDTVGGGVRGIADLRLGAFSAGLNLTGAFRRTATIGVTRVGSELRYGIGGGYALSDEFRVHLEALGNTRFSTEADGSNGTEALLGARYNPAGLPFTFTLGGGTRIAEGVGIPKYRILGGVLFDSEPRDRDRDGVVDDDDACPDKAEDLDGFQDSDGCPDPDNDEDGFLDSVDKCPDDAEDRDGFEDSDGCPELDNDKDGIPDERDLCKNKPETKNDYKDEDGCPDEADQDEDGIPDERDTCVDLPEDTDGFEDTDGCPDLDNDMDGIPDTADECVDQPETINGFEDTNGCPDTPPKGFKIPKEFRERMKREAAEAKARAKAEGKPAPAPAAPAPAPAAPAPAPAADGEPVLEL